MGIVVRFLILLLFPVAASAAPGVLCSLEYNGDEADMSVPVEADALGGAWTALGRFKVRALLAAPAGRAPWLLVEVYARVGDGDDRMITSQKVFAPFTTGRMEVAEPGLGRVFRYECRRRP